MLTKKISPMPQAAPDAKRVNTTIFPVSVSCSSPPIVKKMVDRAPMVPAEKTYKRRGTLKNQWEVAVSGAILTSRS